MSTSTSDDWRRRDFLTRAAIAGTAGLLGVRPEPADAELPPETTTVRFSEVPAACQGPLVVAEELLKADGLHRRAVHQVPGGREVTTGRLLGKRRPQPRDGRGKWAPVGRAGGLPLRVLRAVHHQPGALDPRPEGQDRGRTRPAPRPSGVPRRLWPPLSASIRTRTSPGSSALIRRRSNSSPRGRSM